MIGYHSTADGLARVGSFKEALFQGQAPDGGLYAPDRVPQLDIEALRGADFATRARAAMLAWLDGELPPEIVERLCSTSFNFPVPLVELDADTALLELFHGPTAAFKDFGARFAAQSMALLRDRDHRFVVLVATSGDTGSAVAHAFAGLAAARVVLLYPAGKVSPLQELQLTSVPENVFSLRVDGTFDDCQKMVKAVLADATLAKKLGLTSANSINIGRLLPQTTYHVHASLELSSPPPAVGPGMPRRIRPERGEDTAPLVCVPSGNLGNLTAGLLAKRQGAPIARFLAATNRNDVVVRWLASGHLRPQPAVATPSNAMDVGNPSNAARILALYDRDLKALRRDVLASRIDDDETLATMRRIFEENERFVCPHTAVALAALHRHRDESGYDGPAIVLATAHPAKFADTVRAATGHTLPLPPALEQLESARRPPRDIRADPAALRAFLHRLA
jgi:threonine synthase